MSRTQVKFLHISDLHLDRELGGKLKLPYEKAEQRRRELRDAFGRALDIARDDNVEIILIAGDLWEEETLSPDTVQFVLDKLGAAVVPVVIAPGNHDYYSPGSHYSSDITYARFGREWPANVTIFRDYDLTTTPVVGLEGVIVSGLAYHSNQPVVVRKLAEKAESREGMLHLAVIHGSRDDSLPPGKMRTLPFSDEELFAQPFDYTALGHYHSPLRIRDQKGMVRAAYPGCTAALTIDDTGEHGAFIGVARKGGVDDSALRSIPLDHRRCHRLKLDISGLTHVQAVEAKIREGLQGLGVKPDDMALVELSGTYPQMTRLVFNDEFVKSLCWHVQIEADGILPEWEVSSGDELNPRTTEALYRVRIHRMMDEAAKRGDEAEVRRLKYALFYGLDALYGRTVTPRSL